MVGDESELLDAFAPSLEEPYHLGICTQVPHPSSTWLPMPSAPSHQAWGVVTCRTKRCGTSA